MAGHPGGCCPAARGLPAIAGDSHDLSHTTPSSRLNKPADSGTDVREPSQQEAARATSCSAGYG